MSAVVTEPEPVGVDAIPDVDRLSRTDHLHTELKGRSIHGGTVLVWVQARKFVLQASSTAVLARPLTPPDYGPVTAVAVLTGVVGQLKDLGLSMAAVQRAVIAHAQVSTLFRINVAICVLLVAVRMALAPDRFLRHKDPRLAGGHL